jgi:hypothetical protein
VKRKKEAKLQENYHIPHCCIVMSRYDAFNWKTGVQRIQMLQQCSNKPNSRKMSEAGLHNIRQKIVYKTGTYLAGHSCSIKQIEIHHALVI